MITFYVLVSARLSEKWESNKELCFRERKSFYLTLKLAKITQAIINLPFLNLID